MKIKKFIIFLIVVVGVLTIGLTTYYFVRNNERISISAEHVYCNVGDEIPVSSLGIKVKNKNTGKKTKFNYNAGEKSVTDVISYDSGKKAYVVNTDEGGVVEVVISTTNKKFKKIKFKVFIGAGTSDDPYYIKNQEDLNKIGSQFALNKSYLVMSDIELGEGFAPIGFKEETGSTQTFEGHFDGNNKTISNMNLSCDYGYAGLFAKIGANATVENLRIAESSISGNNSYVGVLAGSLAGKANNIDIVTATISTTSTNFAVGGFAGSISGDVQLSFVQDSKIELSSVSGVVGGFAGVQDRARINACYANNVEIVENNAQTLSGGFVGKLLIGSNSGRIMQSYANVNSNSQSFSGFIGEIAEASDFSAYSDKMLCHLVGNFAVMNNFSSSAEITDSHLVGKFNKNYFTHPLDPNGQILHNETYALYMVRGFASVSEISSDKLVFYAMSPNTKTLWNLFALWALEDGCTPVLREDAVKPANPTVKYLERVLTDMVSDSTDSFMEALKEDVVGETIKLTDDIDLTKVYWTPVSLKNCVLDGNNKTITLDVNVSVGAYAGLFTIIENSKISNLRIKMVGNVVSSVEFFGALAAQAFDSEINGVVVEYAGATFNYANITDFGGLLGTADPECLIKNSRVVKLANLNTGKIKNAGILVGTNYGEIYRCNVEGTVTGLESVGGVVGENYGYIHTVETASGDSVTLEYNNNYNGANIGAIAGLNGGRIADCKIKSTINIQNCETKNYVGGAVGTNTGTISNSELSGNGISVANVSGTIIIGGVAGVNKSQGNIDSVINIMKTIGTCNVGAKQYVGGAVGQNQGTVKKVVVHPDLFGNYVSGVVAIMSSGSIDQVAVGKSKYNMISDVTTFTENKIEGDKYVAGVSVQFDAGTISNIQTKSLISGKLDSTRSSLIVLIFPNGAKFTNSAIDNSFAGRGYRYQETWSDYSTCADGSEFDYAKTSSLFNIYMANNLHGCMQGVVINGNNNGVQQAIKSQSIAFWWLGVLTLEYEENNSSSSYVKTSYNFNNSSEFVGSFSFVVATYSALVSTQSHYVTRTLSFNFGSIWQQKNGIELRFVTPLFEYLD